MKKSADTVTSALFNRWLHRSIRHGCSDRPTGNRAGDRDRGGGNGAGRVGSRKEAKATLLLEEFENDMAGIVADTGVARLDEAPKAYKDPAEVMEAQRTLVKYVDRVKPFICVKG